MQRQQGPDTLDRTVQYLAKRDGIDKVCRHANISQRNQYDIFGYAGPESHTVFNKACAGYSLEE